ncbi:uncharacterized protein LOC115401244 isoform X2 [Salarias fasciatus]|uniref:uncharacterized protein LOC115401244 isoform X2 n=1 Tax=Salarias fasciatus TaxID=181472 RepID=UPI001176B87B|nr:uncharacterized protein LOC115401244 isoform X2 [Salarias fasciatus]
MWLALLTFSSVFFGLCVGQRHYEICYGRDLRFSLRYTPPLYKGPLYFSPHRGGPMKTLMDEGKSQHPRLSVSIHGVILQDVREEDEGYFSVSLLGNELKIIDLKVVDCAQEITMEYWDSFQYRVRPEVDFVEFTRLHNLKNSSILWNRKNREMYAGSRGAIKDNLWNLPYLTQKDDGYYNFREKNNNLVSRILLNVKERIAELTVYEDDHLEIVYPWLVRMKTMTFTPEGQDEPASVMTDGRLQHDYWFNDKIQAVTNGIEVFRAEGKDTGTFRFKDSDGNLIMVVHLTVNDGSIIETISFVSVGLLIPATIMLYCCRCCAKKHYKKYHSAPETPAPPEVDHHGGDQAARPAPPSYTLSYHHVKVPKSPRVTSSGPPVSVAPTFQCCNVNVLGRTVAVSEPVIVPTHPQVYQPANVIVTATQPEVTPSGGWKSTLVPPVNSDSLSSDCEPVFKLKGVEYSSASPLSSDSTLADVYTSDKLNFR